MTREEAIKIIKECKEKGFKYTFYTLEEYHTALDMAIKALEQEPKTGHWISLDDFRGKYNENGFMCSECNEHSDYEANYCPSCGAKMVEPQESEVQK